MKSYLTNAQSFLKSYSSKVVSIKCHVWVRVEMEKEWREIFEYIIFHGKRDDESNLKNKLNYTNASTFVESNSFSFRFLQRNVNREYKRYMYTATHT